MKWSININQRAAIEMKLEVDIIDLAIFDMLKDYTPSPACKKMQENGQQYFRVPYKKVLEELPLLPVKTDALYRRFKKLESAGLIQMHPDNAKLSMVWFMWGRNYTGMVSHKTPGLKTEGMPETLGLKTAPPRFKNRPPSVLSPTHTNTFPINSSSYSASEVDLDFSTVEAERKSVEGLVAPPPAAPISRIRELAGVNYKIKEGFAMSRKIPSAKFDDYLTAFDAEISATNEPHKNDQDLIKHFLNFSSTRYSIEQTQKAKQAAAPKPPTAGLPRDMVNLNAL